MQTLFQRLVRSPLQVLAQGLGQLVHRRLGSRHAPARSPTRLIVGLGNPGQKYAATRHNVGFRVLDLLSDRCGGRWQLDAALVANVSLIEIAGESCMLMQPQTFMNRSGASVLAALEQWPDLNPDSDLLIVYDDMDLPAGRLRLRSRGGGGGHRGIADILLELNSKEIPRLRFGVGHPGASSDVVGWVLTGFTADEELTVLPGAVARAGDAIEATIRDGLTSAMGQFNRNS